VRVFLESMQFKGMGLDSEDGGSNIFRNVGNNQSTLCHIPEDFIHLKYLLLPASNINTFFSTTSVQIA
jgi:hypothetical protein